MRLRWAAIVCCVAMFAACKGQHGTPKLDVDPVTEAEAKAFGDRIAALAKPCDVAKVADEFDENALAGKYVARSQLPNAAQVAQTLAKSGAAPRVFCAWMRGIDEYKLLRVHVVDGEPRPIMRRQIHDPRTGALIVAYDELQLGKTKRDQGVRIVDVFSFIQGMWITDLVGANADAAVQSIDMIGDLPQMANEVAAAHQLQRAGKNADAKQMIDQFPLTVRHHRGVQMIRVRAAGALGKDTYRQALEELATVFGNDRSIAMTEADGAFALGDYDAALKWIDIVDKAVGGDAFQQAYRALAYLKRGKPGDAELAAKAIDDAIATEPTLARPWEVKLDIMVAQKRWADAIAVMTELEDKHGVQFDDAKLAAEPSVAELLASPEYKEWRAGRRK